MIPLSRICLIAAPAALLAACAANSDRYPSLQKRDFEHIPGAASSPIAPRDTQLKPGPGTVSAQRLKQLTETAAGHHRAFVADTARAQRLVKASRGAGAASNSWAQAQIALANLEAIRSQTAITLADLDKLYVDATLAFEQRELIADARLDVMRMVSQQDGTLAQLRR